MFKAIGLFLRLPWQALLAIALVLCIIGYDAHGRSKAYEQEKADALASGVPAPVALDLFDADDVHLADEVHVTAWINMEYNYELTLQKRGADTVRRMFVLFGPGDGPESKVARGVVVIHPDSVDSFMELLLSGMTDMTDARMLFNLNGRRAALPDLYSMVDDALAEKGLQKDADFFAVTPFLEGRDVALKPDPHAAMNTLKLYLGLALVCVILAMKNYGRVRQEPVKRSLADVEIPPVGAPIAGFGPATGNAAAMDWTTTLSIAPPPISGDWSPLEAVKAKQAQRAMAAVPAPSDGWESPIKSSKPGGLWRNAAKLLVFIPVYGFVSLVWDWNNPPAPEMAAERFADVVVDGGASAADAGAADVAAVAVGTPEAGEQDAAAPDPALAVSDTAPEVRDEEGEGIYWAPTSLAENALYLVLTLLAAAVLKVGLSLRGSRKMVTGGRDPWDRLSERLR